MSMAKRVTAITLVLTMLFSMFASTASAASSVSFKNVSYKTYTVKTKNAPWYTFKGQKITVENTGSTSMAVHIYKNGVTYKSLVNLKPGKSHTFSLGTNTTYTLALTPHHLSGGKISGYVSSNKYVSSVK